MFISPLAARRGGSHSSSPPLRGLFRFRVPLMDANKLQSLAELGAVEGAKMLPPAAAFTVYGVTLQTWALAIPVLYYLALLLDLIGRRWVVPLFKALRDRSKPAGGPADDAD